MSPANAEMLKMMEARERMTTENGVDTLTMDHAQGRLVLLVQRKNQDSFALCSKLLKD